MKKTKRHHSKRSKTPQKSKGGHSVDSGAPETLLVDAYNIIFSWDELIELADESLEAARRKLLELLEDYQGAEGVDVVVVFDAHKVRGGGRREQWGRLSVVYTAEGQTADSFIEGMAAALAKRGNVCVATSDALEQVVAFGHGARRMPAGEFVRHVAEVRERIRSNYLSSPARSPLIDSLDPQTAQALDHLRYSSRR